MDDEVRGWAAAMAELLALRGVGKGIRRGGRWLRVLVDVSLDVGPGELVAVVGARGEGKTTLLKVAAGLELPDDGEVCLGEVALDSLSDEERSRLLGTEIAWVHREGTGVKFEVLDYVGLPLAMGRGRGRRRGESSRCRRSSASARRVARSALGRALELGAACWSGSRAVRSASRKADGRRRCDRRAWDAQDAGGGRAAASGW